MKLKLFKSNQIKNFPKISIISPFYNRQRFLLRFITNIQIQNFKDIEIIFVDDCSLDNGAQIIEQNLKQDKRILLLKNKINKGTFISRNLGVLYSKGKYILLIDPDDLISKNILNICFKYTEKYKFEFIKYMFWTEIINNKLKNIINKSIYKKELPLYQFYRSNEKSIAETFDFNVCNKFIKKIVYIRALNSLKNYVFSLYMTYSEDFFFNFFLHKEANSFFILKKLGYYNFKNSISITKGLISKSKIFINFQLVIMKSFFENTKNNKYEKDIINILLTNYFTYLEGILYNSNYYYYNSFLINNIINIFLKCKYINNENKLFLIKIRNKIEKSYKIFN